MRVVSAWSQGSKAAGIRSHARYDPANISLSLQGKTAVENAVGGKAYEMPSMDKGDTCCTAQLEADPDETPPAHADHRRHAPLPRSESLGRLCHA